MSEKSVLDNIPVKETGFPISNKESGRKIMSVRCKFRCHHKTDDGQVCLSPVYSGSEENKSFFKATPAGEIRFFTVNPAALGQFQTDKEYYVDFTPAS